MSQVFTPHDYQLEALEHLYEHRRCGLWMPMGGGKTPVTLTALDTLSLCEDVFPALVLAPKRVALSVWPVEAGKWEHLKHLRVSSILGDVRERRAALRRPADIYTMNYDNLVWLVEELDGEWPFRTVVSDEWTRLKSFRLRQGSKRARALGGVVHAEKSRFIGLTGTPNPNGLKDLWGQLWFVDRGKRLGKTFTAFNDRWFKIGYDGYSMQPLPHAQAEIETLLRDVCLTVEGLPVDQPIVNDIWVDLPPKARRIYDDMHHDLLATIRMHEVEAANAAVKTNKVLQIANGSIYYDDEKNWEVIHDAKMEALDSVIEEANGASVLVSYNFVSDLARLQKRYPWGRHLDTNKQTLIDWNACKIPLLFAHPKSAGHGLNMAEGGNILAFFSLTWNLEEYLQIIERIGPQRQKQAGLDRPVFIHRIMARRTIDVEVSERLEGKRSVQDIMLDAMRRAFKLT